MLSSPKSLPYEIPEGADNFADTLHRLELTGYRFLEELQESNGAGERLCECLTLFPAAVVEHFDLFSLQTPDEVNNNLILLLKKIQYSAKQSPNRDTRLEILCDCISEAVKASTGHDILPQLKHELDFHQTCFGDSTGSEPEDPEISDPFDRGIF